VIVEVVGSFDAVDVVEVGEGIGIPEALFSTVGAQAEKIRINIREKGRVSLVFIMKFDDDWLNILSPELPVVCVK
jgi:hypothetical protein